MVAIAQAQDVSSPKSRRWYYECDDFGNCRTTAWSDWGRWVALVVILVSLGLLFLGCSLISARRRRAAGLRPFYGTAWALPKYTYNPNDPPQDSRFHYEPSHDQYAHPPAPPYSPPAAGYFQPQNTGTTVGPNNQYEMNGYSSVPLNNYQQQTGQTGGANAYYPPPPGPPPAANENPYYSPPSNPQPAHTNPDKM